MQRRTGRVASVSPWTSLPTAPLAVSVRPCLTHPAFTPTTLHNVMPLWHQDCPVHTVVRISLGCLSPCLGDHVTCFLFPGYKWKRKFVYDFRDLFLFILLNRNVYNLIGFTLFRCLYSLLLSKDCIWPRRCCPFIKSSAGLWQVYFAILNPFIFT